MFIYAIGGDGEATGLIAIRKCLNYLGSLGLPSNKETEVCETIEEVLAFIE